MSLFLDKKYVSLISPKLERFQQKSDYVWTFRCTQCGDSKKNKFKTRGYFYRKKSNLSFTCHNCHASMSLGNFIKTLDPHLFQEYQMERYKEESHGNVAKPDFTLAKTKPVFAKKAIKNLPDIQSLSSDHKAKVYVLGRKIPEKFHTSLYYAEDFVKFVAETFPNYDVTRLQTSDERLVIPFFDEAKNLLGVQGRSLDKEAKIRYITIKSDETSPKLFGLDRLDKTKSIIVTEGPIDSLFIDNAVATMDAALYKIVDMLGDLDYVFVPDIQPRNPEVVKSISRCIKTGKKVCIWPKSLTYKDINDMVLAGIDVMKIISENTFDGLRAKLEFEMWRKV